MKYTLERREGAAQRLILHGQINVTKIYNDDYAVVEVIAARRVIEIAQHLSTSLEVFAPKAELVELLLPPTAVIELPTQKDVLLEIVISGPQGPRSNGCALSIMRRAQRRC